jgi:cytidylate kinase
MPLPAAITIDGPAASGKSTLGKRLADAIGYLYFDTGVMYRAVTWAALERRLVVDDEQAISDLAQSLLIDVRPASRADGRSYDVWVDGQDITWQIRRAEVEANVSVVSAYARVRAVMAEQQRRIGLRGRVVMVGRDIGTVVLPEANLKIYLEASAYERARRRWHELQERGEQADFEAILAAIEARDQIDSSREVSPLRPAHDAIILDSDKLDASQVLDEVLKLLKVP